MATAGEIRAGKAFVELILRDNKFVTALNAVSKKLSEFSRSLAKLSLKIGAIGTAIKGVFTAAVSEFRNAGVELHRMSLRTGISVETLSRLKHVSDVTGISMAHIEEAAKNMQSVLAEELGADVVSKMSLEKVFIGLLRAISEVQDESLKASYAMAIFGQSAGSALLPYLNTGRQGIIALSDDAEKLGLVWTTEQARMAATTYQAWTQMMNAIMMVVYAIGEALAPVFQKIAEYIIPAIGAVKRFVQENANVIVVVAAVAAGLIALSSAVATVSVVFSGISTIIGLLTKALGLLATAILGLMSPIGLVVAGVAGLGAAWLYLSDTGKKLRTDLANSFQSIKSEFMDAWNAIVESVKSGDFESALEILSLAVERIWRGLVVGIREKWNETIAAMIQTLRNNPWIFPLLGAALGFKFGGPWGALIGGVAGVGGAIAFEYFHRDIQDKLSLDVKNANQKLIDVQERLRQAIDTANRKGQKPPPLAPKGPGGSGLPMKPPEMQKFLTGAQGTFVVTRVISQLYIDRRREETNGILRDILKQVEKLNDFVKDGMEVNR